MLDDKEVYIPGLFNIYCMSCNRKYKSNEIRRRWDGLYVCDEDWEPRHPQDFVRGVPEESNKLPFSFDVDGDASSPIGAACTLWNSRGIAGIAVAGCGRAGEISAYQGGPGGGAQYLDGTSGAPSYPLNTPAFTSPDTPTNIPNSNVNSGGMPISEKPGTPGITTTGYTGT
jgi:hypothetical protein